MQNEAALLYPSGRQFEIHHGDWRAVITEAGAGLRVLEVNGRALLDTYGEDEIARSSRGQVLIPWPNRIDHGTYTFNGVVGQLPINEVSKQNAIHGLTRWMNWRPVLHEANRLVMSLTLLAQQGYPFVLSLEQTYTLTPDGLEVTTRARNSSRRPLPFGVGHHPYFAVSADSVDPCLLHVPAQSYFRTNERMIPVLPPVSVESTPFDFHTARPIGDTVMDTCFTDLIPDADGLTRVKLAAPGDPAITVFMDDTIQYIQVFTGDTLAPRAKRRSVAIEPCTCAPDAFNNALGLRILQPGETFSSLWGVHSN
ncbi:MAG TPA: aldose 1-epimerase family protein [Ktedonobacteraceae bacterium]|nr:aldose 1-epimerase family protein [Ktedonobacteraceae bacterium]